MTLPYISFGISSPCTKINLRTCAHGFIMLPSRQPRNLVPSAHVPFGQNQDTELWNNQFPETKILGLLVSRRMRGLVYTASRDKVDLDTFHKSIQYVLEKLGKSKFGFERTAVSNFKSKRNEGSGNELVDYSRAPCLAAYQKARGLWKRDWQPGVFARLARWQLMKIAFDIFLYSLTCNLYSACLSILFCYINRLFYLLRAQERPGTLILTVTSGLRITRARHVYNRDTETGSWKFALPLRTIRMRKMSQSQQFVTWDTGCRLLSHDGRSKYVDPSWFCYSGSNFPGKIKNPALVENVFFLFH